MVEERKPGSGSAERQQVASVIKTLKQIDQRSQERIAQEEREAGSLLQSVAEEIARLEEASEARLQEELTKEEERLRMVNATALRDAKQRCEAITEQLQQRFLKEYATWVKELVSRSLQGIPRTKTP